MIKLTKNETAVYAALRTAATAEDVAVIVEMKKAAVLGVLASLMKKEVVVAQEVEAGNMFARTEAEVELYVEPAAEVKEEPKQEVKEEPKQEVKEEPKQEVKEQKEEKVFDNHLTKDGKPKKVTNAMRVRDKIAEVKAHLDNAEGHAQVMQYCMEVLGQTKQLAKAYVSENWGKVKI